MFTVQSQRGYRQHSIGEKTNSRKLHEPPSVVRKLHIRISITVSMLHSFHQVSKIWLLEP